MARARNSSGARARYVVEQPFELAGREVSVDDEAGFGTDHRFEPACAQLGAERLGAAVLPDDGVVQRLAAAPVPQQCGFALVGDADRAHVGRRDARLGERVARGGELRRPDLARVVLDPARLRINLAKLALRGGDDGARLVEDDAA